ncbi:hypothetical protein B0H16DRAFT_1505370 [Mycena metata]|uniref:F-box domain-containing protein n=1 Tax=Mycena metata TaxID=1033252 RepID=A0AAD7NVF0_9AGAR|nr:hypothetical protein B0H16DRAFT_1505370 [Mycena metata]
MSSVSPIVEVSALIGTGTEMHRSLRIPEIIGLIFSHLNPHVEGDAQALATLARTRKAFHDIALDALWRYQSSIINLLRCMPSDLWEVQPPDITATPPRYRQTWTPRRAIVRSDCESKNFHRVRSLLSSGTHDLVEVYRSFQAFLQGDSLLPNLQKLQWYHHFAPELMNIFLGSRINSIHLMGYCGPGLLPTLASRYSTQLDNVSIRADVTNQEEVGESWVRGEELSLDRLSTFVCALTRVKSLHVRSLNVAAFMHLGHLSTLEILHASLPTSLTFPDIASRRLFGYLREAKIFIPQGAEIGLLPLTAFVRTWNTPALESFEATCMFRGSPAGTVKLVEDLYRALASHCSHNSLQILNFHISHSVEDAAEFVLPGHSLRLLFLFTRLTVLSLRIDAGFALDDATVAELVHSWPSLEELQLVSDTHHHPPGNTLLGIRALAEHCPRLHTLEMTLDATTIPLPTKNPVSQAIHGCLSSLDVAFSSISNASSVAHFLSSIFTSLKEVKTALEINDEEDDGDDPSVRLQRGYHKLWKEVEALIPALVEIQEEEWNYGYVYAAKHILPSPDTAVASS